MTTSNAPKQPATPYDAEIELHQKAQWNADSSFGKALARWEDRREGWLRHDADLAPLHRQLVEALAALPDANKLRLLALWLDVKEGKTPPSPSPVLPAPDDLTLDVATELRTWAARIEAVLRKAGRA